MNGLKRKKARGRKLKAPGWIVEAMYRTLIDLVKTVHPDWSDIQCMRAILEESRNGLEK